KDQMTYLDGRGMLRCCSAAAIVATIIGGVTIAQAQPSNAVFDIPRTGTLKKMNDSGVVRLGYRENSPLFAFIDASKKPVGYSLDLCEIVVEEIAEELGKDIRATYRPVTPENRFELVNSGEIDLECGSTTNNVERRKIAAFSPTMFVTGTKLMVRRGSGILNFRDLAGKTVVLTRGTVHETAIPKLAQRQDRCDLRALVRKAVAVGRAPQSADEPASRGAISRAGAAVRLSRTFTRSTPKKRRHDVRSPRRDSMAKQRKPLYRSLYFQVVVAIVIGVLLGYLRPEWGK